FLNIVINALQATPGGGSVTITTHQVETGYEIRFQDTGSGIAAGDLEHVFEPFYTTKADGTGLGLAITRKIIEAHDGILTIESLQGSGTTVVVLLPASEEGRKYLVSTMTPRSGGCWNTISRRQVMPLPPPHPEKRGWPCLTRSLPHW